LGPSSAKVSRHVEWNHSEHSEQYRWRSKDGEYISLQMQVALMPCIMNSKHVVFILSIVRGLT
jgi:hypothetical protein